MQDELLARIAALEPLSRRLHPALEDVVKDQASVMDYAARVYADADDAPGFVPPDPDNPPAPPPTLGEDPTSMDELLAYLRDHVDSQGVRGHSGRHLAYIPLSSDYYGALGDFVAAVVNPYAALMPVSPGAAQMEFDLIRWCAEILGMPADSGGALLSGGSLAQFSAIVSAREAAGVRGRDIERRVVYQSGQAHHSIEKALKLAGMHEAVRRQVPVDDRYRMDASNLKATIQADRKAGLLPWLICASAGTTDTGAVDPLADLAEIARGEDIWFHVDGAFGGFFVLVEEGRKRLHGIGEADSVILDPHKSLFLPQGSSVVLVRDREYLLKANRYTPAYMQDVHGGSGPVSPVDFSPELSKPFRGPRMWLPLQRHGLAAYRAALEEKCLLARYAHQRLMAMPGFEPGPEPDLSVVIFRYIPERGSSDEFNRRLLETIIGQGRFFMSSTILDGQYTLRLAILSNRTHRDVIDDFLNALQSAAADLSGRINT